MKTFILASGNEHKAEEFSDLFGGKLLKIIPASEKLDVLEDGKSFEENALKKAEAYFNKFQEPIMSDDSGLVVEALPEELGIHTARFGGEGLNYTQRCELLIEKLKGSDNRKAYFVCNLCFYMSPSEIYFFEGRCNGVIAQEIRGKDGFGYDPVFLPDGQEGKLSFSEDKVWKMHNSHRFRACKMAMGFFTA